MSVFVFSNLATSLDGKIATASRVLFPLGTPEDRRHMLVLRRRCDAILMGASTLRAYQKPCLSPGSKRQPVNVVVSSRLDGISPRWPFFTDPRIRRILFVSSELTEQKAKKFTESCDLVRLEPSTRETPVARQIISALTAYGVKSLLVEGGGGVMWDFASQDLIDEYHVTLTPRILGGESAPTLVDGPGLHPKDVVNLKLVRCKKIKDELYLTYRKTARRG